MTLGMGDPHRSNPFPLPSRESRGLPRPGYRRAFRWQYLSGRPSASAMVARPRVSWVVSRALPGESRAVWSHPPRLCL